MSATNHTPNYSLPQFIGTDVPTWLVDVNGAFSSIDTAIKNAADAAGTVAGDVTSLGNRVTAVENGLTTTNGNLGALQTTVEGQAGTIAANATKIGTAALITTSQNLSGGINEVVGKLLNPAMTTLSASNQWGSITVRYTEIYGFVYMEFDVLATDNIQSSIGAFEFQSFPIPVQPLEVALVGSLSSDYAPKFASIDPPYELTGEHVFIRGAFANGEHGYGCCVYRKG